MSETRVVHVDSDDWRKTPPEKRVYIGRAISRRGFKASKWANPFKIGPDGTRDTVVEAYRLYIRMRPELIASLPELDGKVLGCWCKSYRAGMPDQECHGDVLVDLVQWWKEHLMPYVRTMAKTTR